MYKAGGSSKDTHTHAQRERSDCAFASQKFKQLTHLVLQL